MNRFRFVYKYIFHFLTARHTGGFGIHSPFVYQFTGSVLSEKHYFYAFTKIEELRKHLEKDGRKIEIEDFGTGYNRHEEIKFIARHSVKSAKYGQLLFRIVNYFKFRNILELGTSLGVTTMYLAASSSAIDCVSVEGSSQLAEIAKSNFEKVGIKNIEVVCGNIDEVLEGVVSTHDNFDLVFIDANHRRESTLRYFDQLLPKVSKNTIIILDDIYWSDEMEEAWKIIKSNPKVTVTIDLFQLGIVFFNPDLYKKDYKMRY